MSVAIVFAGGVRPPPEVLVGLEAADVVIAADSGLDHAFALGHRVDVVVGDLDSVSPDALARGRAAGVRIEQHPADKDATDLELALAAAVARGVQRVVVVGGGGGRVDHFLANALALTSSELAAVDVEARLGDADVVVIRAAAVLHGEPGSVVSLLAVGGPARGVETTGLRFPLRHEDLHPGSTRGVSNELLGTDADVSLTGGVLLAVLPHDRKASVMNRLLALVVTVVLAAGALLATPTAALAATAPKETITLVTHDSFAVSKSVLAQFTKETGIKVKILQNGDAGAALNQAILTKDHPLGDVFFGVDNTFLQRALDAGIFEPYTAERSRPGAGAVPARRHAPAHPDRPRRRVHQLRQEVVRQEGPRGPADPRRPRRSRRTRGCSWWRIRRRRRPASRSRSQPSPKYGEDGWRDYWSKLRANDVKVVDGWESAYDGDFTQGGNKGTRPLVVSYASSPPAAVYYSKPQPKTSPVGTMLDSCFRQVEFAGILQGTEHDAAARKLVDFMLSPTFQADMPLQMFVFPVRDGVAAARGVREVRRGLPEPVDASRRT